jgi:hypothetical protein
MHIILIKLKRRVFKICLRHDHFTPPNVAASTIVDVLAGIGSRIIVCHLPYLPRPTKGEWWVLCIKRARCGWYRTGAASTVYLSDRFSGHGGCAP